MIGALAANRSRCASCVDLMLSFCQRPVRPCAVSWFCPKDFQFCMSEHSRGGRPHKNLQLCRQVQDALTYALTDFNDSILDTLTLISVQPAPSAARLLVTFTIPSNHQNPEQVMLNRDHALTTLRSYTADIREEVTAEINRKRAPELVFCILTDAELRAEQQPARPDAAQFDPDPTDPTLT